MMRLAVDAWAPGFGPSTPGDADLQPTGGAVDVGREVPAGDWAPRRPPAEVTAVPDVVFVDGVRRIDARVWATVISDDGGQAPHTRAGLAVSYGAGAVRSNGHAIVETCEVRRELFGPAGMPVLAAGPVRYTPVAVAGSDDDALVAAVQQQMRDLEIAVAQRVEADLVVVDGPLYDRIAATGAVGYIKTHHTAYLPPVVEGVVAALAAGERTPVFVTQNRARYSWYLRLPHATGHPWAGVVRCEAAPDLPLEQATRLADQTAATLPRFASQPHRDPRAPQNLHPIAGLERALKRRLGDPALLERRLRQAAAALVA